MAVPELLSVIIPVYNERATLRVAIERMLKAELPVAVEVVVVDDGSTDGSVETIQDLADSGAIRILGHRANRGKGAAVRTGLKHTSGDVITILDADLEYDPGDYKALLEPIMSGLSRIAYGTRSFHGHTAFSFWYVIGNKVVALWTSLLFNTWLTDIATCFKMADAALWRSLDLRSNGFGIDAELTAKFLRAGKRIYEVPISYRARRREEGKKVRWTDGLEQLWLVLRVRALGR
jgi:glycosyltransferase involved in cell wall biosynthesis